MKSYKEAGINMVPDLAPIWCQISAKSYGRAPISMNSDKRISGTDVRVFNGVSSFVYQGNVCRESHSRIAERSGVTRQQVTRSIKALLEYGHLVAPEGRVERKKGWLILPQVVFGQKQGDCSEIISQPRKRLVSVEVASV